METYRGHSEILHFWQSIRLNSATSSPSHSTLPAFNQRDHHPSSTPTVIIDGLDECENRDSQRLILNAISDAVFKDEVKLRFLIASRPEPQIYEIFLAQPLHQRHYPILLKDDFETREELLQHLRKGFEDICKRKPDLMYSVQKPAWENLWTIYTGIGSISCCHGYQICRVRWYTQCQ
jgi:hypothetical protein